MSYVPPSTYSHQLRLDIEELPKIYGYRLYVTVKLRGKTGLEMEALTGVSTGLLTYMICKGPIDKSMVIENIQLEKNGGKSVILDEIVTRNQRLSIPVVGALSLLEETEM